VKIHEYFPKLLNGVIGDDSIQMDLEYIRGIPFYTLFKNKMLTGAHLSRLLDMVEIMHHTNSLTISPTGEQIANNYIEKFKRRLADTKLYPFANCDTVRADYLKRLEEFFVAGRFAPVQIIHGDLWFSNIILEFGGDIKLIDMRGEVDGIPTLGGDAIYDYAKLYQSLRGFDAILYGDEYDESYAQSFIEAFKRHLERIHMSIDDVLMISDILILGTFHAIDDRPIREKIWNWITQPRRLIPLIP
jgi:tRNA A-37 threonylcarbamoyl transferase component Bud32